MISYATLSRTVSTITTVTSSVSTTTISFVNGLKMDYRKGPSTSVFGSHFVDGSGVDWYISDHQPFISIDDDDAAGFSTTFIFSNSLIWCSKIFCWEIVAFVPLRVGAAFWIRLVLSRSDAIEAAWGSTTCTTTTSCRFEQQPIISCSRKTRPSLVPYVSLTAALPWNTWDACFRNNGVDIPPLFVNHVFHLKAFPQFWLRFSATAAITETNMVKQAAVNVLRRNNLMILR